MSILDEGREMTTPEYTGQNLSFIRAMYGVGPKVLQGTPYYGVQSTALRLQQITKHKWGWVYSVEIVILCRACKSK